MSTLAERYTLATNSDFRNRVKAAIVKTALDIVGEAAALNPNKTEKRHRLGVLILNDPDSWVDQFAFAMTAPDTLTISSVDNDLLFMTSSVWSDLAGVTLAEGG